MPDYSETPEERRDRVQAERRAAQEQRRADQERRRQEERARRAALSPEERAAEDQQRREERQRVVEERRQKQQEAKEKAEREEDELKAERRRRAADAIDAKWQGDQLCPICGTEDWVILDISETRLFTGAGKPMADKVYPVVPVMCRNCGHMLLFNALRLGVIEPQSDETGEEKP
jgi:hypothetical protein